MKALAGNDKTVTIEFSRHEFNLLRRMWDAFLKDPFPQELPTLTGKTLAQITSFKKQIDEIAARYDFDEEYVAKDISEIFQRYDVPADMSHRVFFAKLVHENGSLSITVTHENNPQNQFLIFFDGMNSYRHIDEGDELEVKITPGVFPWPICVVHNSKYLQWFHEISFNIHKDDNITHYSITTPDEIIDVLTDIEPEITALPL